MTPVEFIQKINKQYGSAAWALVDEFRAHMGKDLPKWPPHVFLPYGGWYAVACHVLQKAYLSTDEIITMQEISIAGTWRVTQDIVSFSPGLYNKLISTPVQGDLAAEILFRLPAWCVYIETPGMDFNGMLIQGFWALLEQDVNNGEDELRLYLWTGSNAISHPLHIGKWNLHEAINRMNQTIGFFVDGMAMPSSPIIEQCVSLTLHLCTHGFTGYPEQIRYPQPQKTKNGLRIFPAQKPVVHTIGD